MIDFQIKNLFIKICIIVYHIISEHFESFTYIFIYNVIIYILKKNN
jgi:hypothetical protein